jgi:hypothetical protein
VLLCPVKKSLSGVPEWLLISIRHWENHFGILLSALRQILGLTGNGSSRNIPNTMCGLVGTFLISAKMVLIPCVLWAISGTISNIFLIPNNIRNNLSVPDIMESFYNVPNIAMPILTL